MGDVSATFTPAPAIFTDPQNGLEFSVGYGMAWYVTPCCHASGKGSTSSDTGVACRACYTAVSGIYGTGPTDEVVLAVTGNLPRTFPHGVLS